MLKVCNYFRNIPNMETITASQADQRLTFTFDSPKQPHYTKTICFSMLSLTSVTGKKKKKEEHN